ncbi:MAG: hypothetical protein LBU45_02120 [Azoarcus sp.]|nr:hypothetical protein [Azoarcus sp.]
MQTVEIDEVRQQPVKKWNSGHVFWLPGCKGDVILADLHERFEDRRFAGFNV